MKLARNISIGVFVLYAIGFAWSFKLFSSLSPDDYNEQELSVSRRYLEFRKGLKNNQSNQSENCQIKDCSLCLKTDKKQCTKCRSGMFLIKSSDLNSCDYKCKGELIADTITMTCLDPKRALRKKANSSIFSSVLFSSESCVNKCGMQLPSCR